MHQVTAVSQIRRCILVELSMIIFSSVECNIEICDSISRLLHTGVSYGDQRRTAFGNTEIPARKTIYLWRLGLSGAAVRVNQGANSCW